MFDRYTVLVLLQILSPVPALSYSKNGNKPNVEKHAVIWNIQSQRSIYSTCVSGPGEVSHSVALANGNLNIRRAFSANWKSNSPELFCCRSLMCV